MGMGTSDSKINRSFDIGALKFPSKRRIYRSMMLSSSVFFRSSKINSNVVSFVSTGCVCVHCAVVFHCSFFTLANCKTWLQTGNLIMKWREKLWQTADERGRDEKMWKCEWWSCLNVPKFRRHTSEERWIQTAPYAQHHSSQSHIVVRGFRGL